MPWPPAGHLAITVVVPIAYHVVMVALKGQTLGAMAVKVKVVRLSTAGPRLGPGGGGSLPNDGRSRWRPPVARSDDSRWSTNNERRQTKFDLAAKTVVIDVS